MNETTRLTFTSTDIAEEIGALSPGELDELDFGVIGFDRETLVRLYNDFESKAAGLSADRVLGLPLFTVVAPCMNNFMVAHRFEETAAAGSPMDETIDYVLTLRMRPVKVRLRLIATPGMPMRYLLVSRLT